MLNLTVNREPSGAHATLGKLFADGIYECETLEDLVRPDGVKVDGATAIPCGRYRVIIDISERFSRAASKKAGHPVKVQMPHILDVPGFLGIRIHAGNTDENTEGCLLVGRHRGPNESILESQLAYQAVFTLIARELSRPGGEVWITIAQL